ncbi:MAG: DUF2007 domain-containing protein [Bacteroidales bacterium]|nr:DUF2007 domain-containing protein [Bacteroidales bacterium]
MDSNWTKVYSSPQGYLIEIVKGLLAENDIEAVSINKKDSSYLFGEIELYVPSQHSLKARQILSKHNDL